MKRRILCCLLLLLWLTGCASQTQSLTPEQYARLKAYCFPEPPVVKAEINSEAAIAAFGDVAPDSDIVVRNIDGWHKVRIVYEYQGGIPDDWEAMCGALASGTSSYRPHTSAELFTPNGALLASAADGKLRYNVFDIIKEPYRGQSHEEDLSEYFDNSAYLSNKNAFYHLSGDCPLHLHWANYDLDIDTAVDERPRPCPICARDYLPDAVLNVQQTPVPFIPPIRESNDEWIRDLTFIDRDDTEDLVYITKTGRKYHSTLNCSNMDKDGAKLVSLSDAIESGYTRCSNCW